MEQGTINKDITLKYNPDNNNLVVSTSAVTEKQLTDVSNKVTDLSNRVNADESRINTVNNSVTDLCNEVKTNKDNIEALFARIKWVEKVFIISFSLILLNCFYVVFTLMRKG